MSAGSVSIIIILITLCIFFTFSPSLSGQTLTGQVTNGTTGKPATGDRVALITLGQGMEEVAHTRVDGSGHFTFRLPDSGPHLIRAVHQGVPYHRMALLEQIKNKLFQLEVEHQQGRISRRQYKRARAALDQTLDRAIKRSPLK